MHFNAFRRILTAVLALTLAAPAWTQEVPKAATAVVSGHDWPQWRGPNGNGISNESDWSVEGKSDDVFKVKVGLGYSSVTVEDGRLFTLGHDKDKQEDALYCLDAATGAELWAHRFPAKTMALYHGGGTLTTPSIDGDRVYASNREGRLFCLDAKTGKVHWQKNLVKAFGLKIPTWGLAASPFITGDFVVMNVGVVLAFKKDGELAWKSKRSYGHCYSTPVDMKVEKRDCIVVFGSSGVVLLDRKNGKEATQVLPWKTAYDVNAASPVLIGDRVFVSSGYNHGCAMLRVEGKKLEIVWESKVMRTHMSGCVLWHDHLYGFDEATLKCIDLDGEVAWKQRGLGKGALILADGKLVIASARGELVIAEASPDEYKQLSRTKLLRGGVYWTTPTLSNGLIYLRNSRGHLVCRDHRGQ